MFGAGGYVVQKVLADVLEKSDGIAWTDTIALTVTISAFVVRFMFGRKGPLGEPTGEAVDRPRLTISSDAVWVRHQGEWRMTVAMGLTAGTLAAYAMTSIAGTSVDLATTVVTLGFGFSAVSLLFLQFDQPGPVTHHMTLPAAVAATTVLAAGGAPGSPWRWARSPASPAPWSASSPRASSSSTATPTSTRPPSRSSS